MYTYIYIYIYIRIYVYVYIIVSCRYHVRAPRSSPCPGVPRARRWWPTSPAGECRTPGKKRGVQRRGLNNYQYYFFFVGGGGEGWTVQDYVTSWSWDGRPYYENSIMGPKTLF